MTHKYVRLDNPTKETIEAMFEAERIAKDPSVKSYSVDDAFKELDNTKKTNG